LNENQIKDLTPLKNLRHLKELNLFNNYISELTALKDSKQLIRLNLGWNQISNIKPLKGLSQLIELDLSWNQISDIAPLKGLKDLTKLDLNINQIKDLSALKDLNKLVKLNLDKNQISELSGLKDLKNLQRLRLENNLLEELPVWITDFDMDIQWTDEYLDDDNNLIKGIVLYNNPLKSPPVEIVQQGKAAVKTYFEGPGKGESVDEIVIQSELQIKILPSNYLKLGDKMRIDISSRQGGYITLLFVSNSGEISRIFPNQYSKDSYIKANEKITIPEMFSGFNFVATEFGKQVLIGLLVKDKNRTSVFEDVLLTTLNQMRSNHIELYQLNQKFTDILKEKGLTNNQEWHIDISKYEVSD